MIRNYSCFKQMTKYLSNNITRSSKMIFSTNKQKYIPIRPLRDDQTLIYNIQNPTKLGLLERILIVTPFLAFSLEGIFNQWNTLIISGGFISFFMALKAFSAFKYLRSHQINQLYVDPKVSKFYMKLISTSFTKKIEDQILKSHKTNYISFFKKQLNNNKIQLQEGQRDKLLSLTPKKLQRKIKIMRFLSDNVFIEITKENIQSIQMISQKEIWFKMMEKNRIFNKFRKIRQIFQVYTTDKKQKNIMAFNIKPINDNFKYTVYMNLDKNIEKKYQEYLKAIGQGKTIVNSIN